MLEHAPGFWVGWAVHCPRRNPNAGLGRRVVIGGIAVLRCKPWRLRAPAEDAAHRAGGTDDTAGLVALIFRPSPKPLRDAAALIAHCEAEAAAVLELFGAARDAPPQKMKPRRLEPVEAS